MRKAISMCGLLALLFAAISVAGVTTRASDKAMTWTGWISDSHCGAKGMSADHKACAMTCIKNGSKWVFVNSATKHVIPIANQDAIHPDDALGHQVKVTGHIDKGVLTIDKLEAAT
ncbi:MAG: hypothetical protein WA581_03340 [Candidatus Acidiferrales bacterium]